MFSVSGDVRPSIAADGESIAFATTHAGTALRYDKLHAYDATGASLPSRMHLKGDRITLSVDDSEATYPVTIDPLFSTETRLTAGDGAALDTLGRAVALSGDTALIGAYQDDDGGSASGSAYVFARSGSSWTQQAKLAPSDAAANRLFGFAVAVSGDTTLVGTNVGGAGGRDRSVERQRVRRIGLRLRPQRDDVHTRLRSRPVTREPVARSRPVWDDAACARPAPSLAA